MGLSFCPYQTHMSEINNNQNQIYFDTPSQRKCDEDKINALRKECLRLNHKDKLSKIALCVLTHLLIKSTPYKWSRFLVLTACFNLRM